MTAMETPHRTYNFPQREFLRDPQITIDDFDRGDESAAGSNTPWTVSCRTCQLGVAFSATAAAAEVEARAHQREHRLGEIAAEVA